MDKLITDKYPLVTAFTLIYNTNPRFVIEAIESIRANNYPNIQHIIIDDCSPNPEPKRVVKEWIDRENYLCEFYEHEVNYGISKTLNHVLELAKGDFILGCCDDILYPGRIDKDVKCFLKDKNIDLIHSKCNLIDDFGRLLGKVMPIISESDLEQNQFDKLLISNYIMAPTVSIRVDRLKGLGGYSEKFKIEDYELWLRMSSKGCKFHFRDEITTYYRIHEESFSNANWRTMFVEDIKIKITYTSIFNLKSINNIKSILTRQVQGNISNVELIECFNEFKKKFGISFWFIIVSNKYSQFVIRSINRIKSRLRLIK